MRVVGASPARAQLSVLLSEVANGETICVTRRGIPEAQFAPTDSSLDFRSDEEKRTDAPAAIEGLRRFRQKSWPTLGGITIRELLEEGRT